MLVQPEQLELDSNVRRSSHNTALLGGSPFRLIRLSRSGAALLDSWLAGEATTMSSAAVQLRARLINAGVVHPVVTPCETLPSFAVVVPVFNDDAGLDSLLAELRQDLGDVRIVVVDDCSNNPLKIAQVASSRDAELLVQPRNLGPAAARNTGWRHVQDDVELVVFLDADVSCPPGSLHLLLAHFTERGTDVAAVAPRVAAQAGATALDQFESVRSPLDLGPHPALVRPRSKISYVPSAALVVHMPALIETGGFDEGMRLGEDVDFVWRLTGKDLAVRYEPQAVLRHRNRSSVSELLRQRFGYGTSAAALHARHVGQVAPVDLPATTFGIWLAALFGGPLLRAGAVVGSGVVGWRLRSLLQDKVQEPSAETARLTAQGHGHAATWLASACRRAWAPLLMFTRPTRRVLMGAHVIAALIEWVRKRPDVNPLTFAVLSAADDSAYCVGVWTGAVRERSPAALLPRLRWPNDTA